MCIHVRPDQIQFFFENTHKGSKPEKQGNFNEEFLNTKGKKWCPLNQRSSAEKERCESPWKHRIF